MSRIGGGVGGRSLFGVEGIAYLCFRCTLETSRVLRVHRLVRKSKRIRGAGGEGMDMVSGNLERARGGSLATHVANSHASQRPVLRQGLQPSRSDKNCRECSWGQPRMGPAGACFLEHKAGAATHE